MNSENQHRSIHEAFPLIPGTFLCLLTAAISPAGELTHPQLMADQSEITVEKRWIGEDSWSREIREAHRKEIDAFIAHGSVYVLLMN